MGGIGNQVGIQQEAPKTWAEVTQTHNSFSVRTATALLALSLVAGQAGAESKKVDPLQTGAQSTLLAQASTETDGKTYQAEVIQVDGTKKKVSYQKYKDGVIIPPETNDWKLVDGSPATSNQKLNIGKNRSILARHDKDSQILLALVDKKDILGKSLKDMWILIKKVQDNESILKDDVFNAMVKWDKGETYEIPAAHIVIFTL